MGNCFSKKSNCCITNYQLPIQLGSPISNSNYTSLSSTHKPPHLPPPETPLSCRHPGAERDAKWRPASPHPPGTDPAARAQSSRSASRSTAPPAAAAAPRPCHTSHCSRPRTSGCWRRPRCPRGDLSCRLECLRNEKINLSKVILKLECLFFQNRVMVFSTQKK